MQPISFLAGLALLSGTWKLYEVDTIHFKYLAHGMPDLARLCTQIEYTGIPNPKTHDIGTPGQARLSLDINTNAQSHALRYF